MWVNEYQGGPFPNKITVSNNSLDATGWDSTTWSPAGIVMTSGGNTITGNTIKGFGSGVFNQVCDGTNVASDLNTFTGNTFTDNRSGIQVYVAGACGATTVNATITNNSFDGGLWSGGGYVDLTKIGVRWNGAARPNDLTADCNWWGSADGPGSPGASTITAGVNVSTWNTTPTGPCDGSI
ncbi:MAG: right-handed parallel beta-helix repeat-containing protein [Microthrixaceae bacterium]|nr:right-handed parallel beta-helix repeat-containing protein [Microthrixaceae bacterium]